MLVSENDLEASAKQVCGMMRLLADEAMNQGVVNRRAFHIIFARRIPVDPFFAVVHQESFGDLPREEWEYPFDDIAAGKATITGRTGLPTSEVILQKPNLLLPGDVRYWGSWIEGERIVAGSGWKSHHDEAMCKSACSWWTAYDEQAYFDLSQAADQSGSFTL